MIVGHAHPQVVNAVKRAANHGTSYGAPTPIEVRLAEMLVRAVPSMAMVRLVNSGTEAVMSAIRLARAATTRDLIIKFDGGYHGHADSLLVKAGSGAATFGLPDSPGVPSDLARQTLTAPYNDLAATRRLFEARAGAIAAVIVEPIAGNMGVVPPEPGFLEGLRALTAEHGALLIFDEVISGFRAAYGGAQALYGVVPDLTCLGKIIGGGLPVGAYGGRRDLMELIAPAGPVYQAGTLSGNPLAVSAGLRRAGGDGRGARIRIGRRRQGRRRAGADQSRRVGPDRLLHADPRAGLCDRQDLGHRALRPFFLRHAERRYLPAPLAIRGLVHLPRPHRARDPADDHGWEGSVRGPELASPGILAARPSYTARSDAEKQQKMTCRIDECPSRNAVTSRSAMRVARSSGKP
jgi:hypothetical protein